MMAKTTLSVDTVMGLTDISRQTPYAVFKSFIESFES
jgi:hypothetical protein